MGVQKPIEEKNEKIKRLEKIKLTRKSWGKPDSGPQRSAKLPKGTKRPPSLPIGPHRPPWDPIGS